VRAKRVCGLLLALALPVLAPACITIGRTTIGSMPPQKAVLTLRHGQTIPEVLAACGAPVEAWAQPEGLLLMWRRRRYDYGRYGLDASQALRFVTVSNVLADIVGNLSLTIEDGTLGDDRLAVLFDREGRVVAISQRTWDGGAP
jgi:hypothetical protein